MNKTRKALINDGIKNFQAETISGYEKSYQKLLEQGRRENKETQHKYANSAFRLSNWQCTG